MRPWRTSRSRRPPCRRYLLQCGHGHEAVENADARTCNLPDVLLQCGHGHEAVENSSQAASTLCLRRSFNAATAMRPWRTSADFGVILCGVMLQCGHGHEAVENAAAEVLACLRIRALQCGHGHEAVENPNTLSAYPTGSVALQCGHGHEAVENGETIFRRWWRFIASMRPRP